MIGYFVMENQTEMQIVISGVVLKSKMAEKQIVIRVSIRCAGR